MKGIWGICVLLVLSTSLGSTNRWSNQPTGLIQTNSRLMDISLPHPNKPFNHTNADNKDNDSGIIEWQQRMPIYYPGVGEFNITFAMDAFLSFIADETIKPNGTINLTSEITPRSSKTTLEIQDVRYFLEEILDPIMGEYLPGTLGGQEISYESVNDVVIGIDTITIDEILGENIIFKTVNIPIVNWTISLTFTLRTSIWIIFRYFFNNTIHNYWSMLFHKGYGVDSLPYQLPAELNGEKKISVEAGYIFSLDSLKIAVTIVGDEIQENSEVKLPAVNNTKSLLFWEPTVNVWLASASLYLQIVDTRSSNLFDMSLLTPFIGILCVMGYRLHRKRKKYLPLQLE